MAPKKANVPEASAAQSSDGVVSGKIGEAQVDATGGNTATQGVGSVDDLRGLSFTGFNPMPSTTLRPSSLFDSFSSLGASW